jgi:hypothetical protein
MAAIGVDALPMIGIVAGALDSSSRCRARRN